MADFGKWPPYSNDLEAIGMVYPLTSPEGEEQTKSNLPSRAMHFRTAVHNRLLHRQIATQAGSKNGFSLPAEEVTSRS